MIPVFEPYLKGNEAEYVRDCVDTNWISSQGRFVGEFEGRLADYHGRRHCIATSSCTSALHLSLLALGIGAGDEVICPALTFIAPANMIALTGAEVALVDVEPDTLALDPDAVAARISTRTRALLVVHQFGHAAPMGALLDIAEQHSLAVIEDNAESLGGRYKETLLGTIGDLSCCSFFANKVITTGEGGAILTDDDGLAHHSRVLRDHGMSTTERYRHTDLGFNYRMTNLQAAVGVAQMEQLESIIAKRLQQMETYYSLLDSQDGFSLRGFANWCSPMHWLMTIKLDPDVCRRRFIARMHEQGVECRPMINPVHHAAQFQEGTTDDDFPHAVSVSRQSVHLPSSTGLRDEELKLIALATTTSVAQSRV